MLPCRAPWPPDRQSTGRWHMTSSKKNQRQPAIDPALLAELIARLGKEVVDEGFIGVPASVSLRYRRVPGNEDGRHMTPTEFLILTALWPTWWSGDAQQVPSLPQIAEQTGLSVRQIQRYLRRIEASGWVSILPQHNVEGGQLPNLYDFSPFVTRLIDSLDGEETEVRHG